MIEAAFGLPFFVGAVGEGLSGICSLRSHIPERSPRGPCKMKGQSLRSVFML